MRILAILLVCCMLSSCAYLSSNIIKVRGDKIKGNFAGSPVNIDGENIVITVYREMIWTWKNLTPRFFKTVKIEDDKEKGDILLEK